MSVCDSPMVSLKAVLMICVNDCCEALATRKAQDAVNFHLESIQALTIRGVLHTTKVC